MAPWSWGMLELFAYRGCGFFFFSTKHHSKTEPNGFWLSQVYRRGASEEFGEDGVALAGMTRKHHGGGGGGFFFK